MLLYFTILIIKHLVAECWISAWKTPTDQGGGFSQGFLRAEGNRHRSTCGSGKVSQPRSPSKKLEMGFSFLNMCWCWRLRKVRFVPLQWFSFSARNSTWTENWWLGKIEGRHMQSTVKQVLSIPSLCCFCSLHSHYFMLFKSGEEPSQWEHLLLLGKHGTSTWSPPWCLE